MYNLMWQLRLAHEKLQNAGAKAVIKEGFKCISGNLTEPHPLQRMQNACFTLQHGRASDFVNENWDNLIILDACRFDAFEQQTVLNNPIESKISCASNTTQFLQHSFVGKSLHDTVYVTANPKGADLASRDIFHNIVSLMNEWSSEYPTIHPEKVTKAAITARKTFPNKRLIIHYMQPHAPFIGEKAEQIHKKLDALIIPNKLEYKDFDSYGYDVVESNSFDITQSDLWEAYLESLEIALEEIQTFINKTLGKTAISADHGELFNEPIGLLGEQMRGHPMKVKTEQLRKVPWYTVDHGPRPEVVPEDPVEQKQPNYKKIDKQLSYLGYK
jgi:hypothetical protein